MALKTYCDQVIILRKTKLGEADAILTMLSACHGQIRAIAKGVRRTGSKFGSRLSPFNCVNLQLYEGQNLDTVVQAESVHLYAGEISGDYGKYLAGQVILETAERLTEDFSDPDHYQFLLGAIGALVKGDLPAPVVLSSYLLASLGQSGWAPSWKTCVACGVSQNLKGLSLEAGGAICGDCLAGQGRRVPLSVLQLLDALQHHRWVEVARYSAADRSQAEAIAIEFTQWFLEKKLKSISVMETRG